MTLRSRVRQPISTATSTSTDPDTDTDMDGPVTPALCPLCPFPSSLLPFVPYPFSLPSLPSLPAPSLPSLSPLPFRPCTFPSLPFLPSFHSSFPPRLAFYLPFLSSSRRSKKASRLYLTMTPYSTGVHGRVFVFGMEDFQSQGELCVR